MFSFSGWTLFSAVAGICRSQGVNILLNIFFSTIVNAARGIAYQVSGIISGFVLNFQLAINPQLVKSHAEGNRKYFYQLIFCGCKISYFLLFILSVPLLFEMPSAIKRSLFFSRTFSTVTSTPCVFLKNSFFSLRIL